MLKLIGAALALWIASAVLRAYRDIQRAREIGRIRHEASAQATEQALIREEQERQRIAAQEYVRRQVAIEREQIRLAREQAALAQVQARQADTLAKHEKRISDLEFKMAEAQEDVEHWKAHLAQLYALLDIAELNLAGTLNGSREQEKYQRKVITLNNQIHAAEKRISKAQHTIDTVQRELVA